MNLDFLKSITETLGNQDERNKILDYLPVISMFLFMLLTILPQIPIEVKPYLMFGGLGVAVGVGAISQEMLKWKASEFQVYKAIIRPTQKRVQLFAKNPRVELRSQLIDPQKRIYQTPIDLAEPRIFDEDKGKSSRVIIRHQLPWLERIALLQGLVTYKGFPDLNHNSVAEIVLWEPKDDKGELDPELMEWVPYFWLAEAPRDWIIVTEPTEFPNAETQNGTAIAVKGGEEIKVKDDHGFEIGLTPELYGKAVEDAKYWRNQAMMARQSTIRTSSLARDAVNTSFAAFSRVRDMGKLVLEELVACLHAHADIEEAAREYKPFTWPKFTTAMAVTIISIAFLYVLVTNAEFRAQIFANLGAIAIGGTVIVGLLWYLKGRIKL